MSHRRQREVDQPVTQAVHLAGERFLQGVERDGPEFVITVRDSNRVIRKARAGDAVTIVAKARQPYNNCPDFMRALFPLYEKIGANALQAFTTLTYTLYYDIVLNKPGTEQQISVRFVIDPCRNNRTVTSADEDFRDERYNLQLFDNEFHLFANKHGSGLTLDKVEALEIQFIKEPNKQRRGSKYFKVDFIQRCGINVENTDNRCFMYALLASLYSDVVEDKTNPSCYEPYINEFKWDGIDFEGGADYTQAPRQFERVNPDAPFALHVWIREPSATHKNWADAIPVYVSKKLKVTDQHVDLYFVKKGEDAHYVSICNLPEFAQHRTSGWVKRSPFMCRICLDLFQDISSLHTHYKQGCYPSPTKNVPFLLPTRKFPVRFNRHSATQRATLFGVVHGNTVEVNGEQKINNIGYHLQCDRGYVLPDDIPIQHVFQSHDGDDDGGAHGLLDLMVRLEKHWLQWIGDNKYASIRIAVTSQPVLTLLIRSLNGFNIPDVKVPSGVRVKFGKLRMFDGSTFVDPTVTRDIPLVQGVSTYNDKWLEFRDFCLKHYQLDPAHFHWFGVFAWEVAMRRCGGVAEIIRDKKIYDFIESAKRGGINIIPTRYATADNTTTYLANFDIKSSYGYSMKQPLPCSDFRFVDGSVDDFTKHYIQSIADDAEKGYYLKVTLSTPHDPQWHNDYSDLPFAPHYKWVNGRRLYVCSHETKHDYVLHYRLLKYYLSKGMILEAVHKVLQFKQKPWLKPFADLQEQLQESYPQHKKIIKLITNSVFGYSCRDPRDKTAFKVFSVSTEKGAAEFAESVVKRGTIEVREIAPQLIKVTKPPKFTLAHKPMYAGITILELGKLRLYEAYYDKLMNYDPSIRLLYTDTDSLICSMSKDPFALVAENPNGWFDNKFGGLKEESGGHRGALFIGTKAKHYQYITTNSSKVCIPGVNKEVSAKVTTDQFVNSIENGVGGTALVKQTHIKDQKVVVKNLENRYLRGQDVTRVVLKDKYRSVPYGYLDECVCCGGWKVIPNDESYQCYCAQVEERMEQQGY